MPEKMSEDMPDTYARKNVKENVRTSARKNARMNPGKDAKQNVRIDAGQNARKNVRIYAGKYVRIGAKQHVKQNAKVYARKNVRYCQIECQNKYAIYIYIHFQMVYQKLCHNSGSGWGSHSKKVIRIGKPWVNNYD